jgi:hypothetical protein
LPKIREFGEADSSTVGRYILAVNMERRHLSMPKRIEITREATGYMVAERNRLRKLEGQRSGGRGHKKNLTPNSASSLEARAAGFRSDQEANQVAEVIEHGTPDLIQAMVVHRTA